MGETNTLRRLTIEQARILHRIHSAAQALERPGRPSHWVLQELTFVIDELSNHRRHYGGAEDGAKASRGGMEHGDVLDQLDHISTSVTSAVHLLHVGEDRWGANSHLTNAFIRTAELMGRLSRHGAAPSATPRRPRSAPDPDPE